jgi:hypothetical protein
VKACEVGTTTGKPGRSQCRHLIWLALGVVFKRYRSEVMNSIVGIPFGRIDEKNQIRQDGLRQSSRTQFAPSVFRQSFGSDKEIANTTIVDGSFDANLPCPLRASR